MNLRSPLLFVAFAVLLTSLPSEGEARRPATDPDQVFLFDVYGDGTRLGEHRVTIRRDGPQTTVDVRIDLRWRLAYITFFRYEHRNHLVWDGDRLVAMESETNDNGVHEIVSVRPTENGLTITTARSSHTVPATILPTTYWRPETIKKTQMLDTQSGRLIDYAVRPADGETLDIGGETKQADTYILSGDLNVHLWYTSEGDWVGMRFIYDGSEIIYRRRPADGPT